MWYYILGGIAILAGGIWYWLMGGMGATKRMHIADVDLSRVEDGVHQGSYSKGRFRFSVAVTVKAHRITGIDLVSKTFEPLLPTLNTEFERVIEAQSPRVDVVSGGTVSCKALLKAIENALTK